MSISITYYKVCLHNVWVKSSLGVTISHVLYMIITWKNNLYESVRNQLHIVCVIVLMWLIHFSVIHFGLINKCKCMWSKSHIINDIFSLMAYCFYRNKFWHVLTSCFWIDFQSCSFWSGWVIWGFLWQFCLYRIGKSRDRKHRTEFELNQVLVHHHHHLSLKV